MTTAIKEGDAFRVIHAADLHLGSGMKVARKFGRTKELREATYEALDNMVSLVTDREAGILTLGGDLFDEADQLNPIPRRKLRDALRQIPDVAVAVVRGNHDHHNPRAPVVEFPSNVTEFGANCKTLDLGWVRVHGVSYSAAHVTESLLPRYPEASAEHFDIGLLHANVGGNTEHEPYAPCTIDELKQLGYRMWLLGHIHKRQVLCEDPLVLYPGNLQGRDAGELGPKSAEVISIDEAGSITHEPAPIHSVLWQLQSLDVTGCATIDDVLDLARAAARKWTESLGGERGLVVRLQVVGQSEAHEPLSRTPEAGHPAAPELIREEIHGEFANADPFVLVDAVCINTSFPLDLEGLAQSETALGVLIRLSRNDAVLKRAVDRVMAEGPFGSDSEPFIRSLWQNALQGALGRIRGRSAP